MTERFEDNFCTIQLVEYLAHPPHVSPAGLAGTTANEQERARAGKLAELIQAATQRGVKLAYGDQGYTGAKPPLTA